MPWRLSEAGGIDLPDFLDHLKEPGAPWYAKSLEGRRDSQADGFVCTAFISYHKIGIQRVKPPLQALHRGVEGLEIYGYAGAFLGHGMSACGILRTRCFADACFADEACRSCAANAAEAAEMLNQS